MTPPPRIGRPDPAGLLVGALVVIYLVPIWWFTYLPTQDGPSHVNNARVLLEYGAPGHDLLRTYFAINDKLVPTWLGHLVLAGLQAVVPPGVAEKLFVSGYVVLFPAAIFYTLGVIRREARFLTLLAFPLVASYPLHMGFYAFSYSLALYVLLLGYWLRLQARLNARAAAALVLLSLLLYLTHLFSLLMLIGAVGTLAAGAPLLRAVGRRRRPGAEAGPWPDVNVRSLPTLALLLPALALALLFAAGQGGESFYDDTLSDRAGALAYLSSIVSYGWQEKILGRITVGLFSVILLLHAAAKLEARAVTASDSLLLLALAYGGLYFVAPNAFANGSYIPERIMLFLFLALLAWFAAQSYTPRARRSIEVAGVVVALAGVGLHAAKHAELDDYLGEYLSAGAQVEPHTTLLALSFSGGGQTPGGRRLSLRVKPFLHAAERIAAERDVVVFPNYQPATGYFPTVWRAGLNPYVNVGLMEDEPPRVEFLHYEQRTGLRIDYVLLWGLRPEHRRWAETRSILRQLDAGYDLVYTSSRRGLVRLYRRRPPP